MTLRLFFSFSLFRSVFFYFACALQKNVDSKKQKKQKLKKAPKKTTQQLIGSPVGQTAAVAEQKAFCAYQTDLVCRAAVGPFVL